MLSTELLSIAAKRDLIARVANSNLFRKSPRLREFLLYAADCTLGNRLEDVREQIIAEKVFQRKAENYDVQDSIVRAEARNLRKRLERYFETEGSQESVLITMPKGGYSLAFQPRAQESQPNAPMRAILESITSVDPTEALPSFVRELAPGQQSSPSAKLRIACICLATLATFACALAVRWYPGRAVEVNAIPARVDTLPFSASFDNKHDTFIVTSDTAFLQIAELEGRRLTLNEYLMRAYPRVLHLFPPDLIQNLNRSQYTDGAETTIAGLLMKRNANLLQRTFLRSGRQLELADFKNRNIVLLGSPVSNPWADLYANQLNFQFDFDSKCGIKLRNRSPHPGEAPVYPAPHDDELNRTYAQVAFLPTASPESGSVLLLAGTTAESTAAAGEFLLSESGIAKTLKKIGIDPKGPARYFELLLRATTFVGGATQSEVIAYRSHPYSIQ